MHTLYFMRIVEEHVRCRVYGAEPTEDDQARTAFVDRLAGEGVLDCPAYDSWVEVLQRRGWLDAQPELEPNLDGPGKVGRWRLNATGRAAWARREGA